MKEVAVVGWAQSEQDDAITLDTSQSMIFRTVERALASCGLTIRDIDFVIDSGSDFLDGTGVSSCLTLDAMGAHFKEETKVAGDGLLAAVYAAMRIASGMFGTGLVVAYGKSSESDAARQSQLLCEPFFTRPLGLDATAAAALQARAYMHHYGVKEEACAMVAVKNRACGEKNVSALLRQPVTLSEVMDSRELVSPIRELEAAPVTDGACAVIMADGPMARGLKERCAWVAGTGYAMEASSLGGRELHKAGAAARAAARALGEAGIADPLSGLDVAEVTETYAHQELMLYEALGLCEEGAGQDLLKSGATSAEGSVPVNLSGGAICANPVMATGLIRLAEVAGHVTGRHREPVRKAKLGIAHASGGLAMQSAACMVVER